MAGERGEPVFPPQEFASEKEPATFGSSLERILQEDKIWRPLVTWVREVRTTLPSIVGEIQAGKTEKAGRIVGGLYSQDRLKSLQEGIQGVLGKRLKILPADVFCPEVIKIRKALRDKETLVALKEAGHFLDEGGILELGWRLVQSRPEYLQLAPDERKELAIARRGEIERLKTAFSLQEEFDGVKQQLLPPAEEERRIQQILAKAQPPNFK